MKRLLKISAILLAASFALSLGACGGARKSAGTDAGGAASGSWQKGMKPADFELCTGGDTIIGRSVDPKELFSTRPDTVDPQQCYSRITADMLHGVYTLNDTEKDEETARKRIPFEEKAFTTDTYTLSVLPVSASFGREYVSNVTNHFSFSEYEGVADQELAMLKFLTDTGDGYFASVYEIDGQELVFKGITITGGEDEPFAYEETGAQLRFGFRVSGPFLTLTNGDESITLKAYCFTENAGTSLMVEGYSLYDSPLVEELDYFCSGLFNYAVRRDGKYYDNAAYKLDGDGRFSIWLLDKDETGAEREFFGQYAYIVQSEAAFLPMCKLVLLDAERAYYYTDSVTQREARILEEQGIDAEALPEEQIKEIAEKTSDLYDDLIAEFEARGIGVTVSRSTGEITMDASVLFGGDSAEITEAGKALLNGFLEAYVSIISNEKYAGYLRKTLIEGHIAPVQGSTYENGLPLSAARAENVMAYCLSEETGVDVSPIAGTLEAVGLSNAKPIYGSDGQVDLNASRRVSFRFVVNVE